jgi:imidazolonepropionase-like amidohydrolase
MFLRFAIACVAPIVCAQTVVIRHANIVDPAASAPVRRSSILVENGRISRVAPKLKAPRGARVIEAQDKYVIAGIWDMHAHLAALTPIGTAPERYVGYGVLYLRDMGGYLDQLLPLRQSIRQGERIGPEIVLAGPTLNGDQPAAFHRKVTSAEEARVAVRELQAAGVDLIKIHRQTPREAFFAIAEESRKLKLPFAGHVPLSLSWIEASQAGIRSIEHIQTIIENIQPDPKLAAKEFESITNRLQGELGNQIFAALRTNETFFDPTLVGYEAAIDKAGPAVAPLRKLAYERLKRIAAQAAKSGVTIVTGTDVLERHGDYLLLELERLVEIGMSPQEVLKAATVNSATAAGHPEWGRVAEGSPASFLILDADPLADVRNVRRLSAVVVRGQLLDAERLAALRKLN